MDIDRIVESIKQIVYQKSGKYLKDLQVTILRESLNGKQYRTIARLTYRNEDSIKKEASLLWQLLSQVFGEKVAKFNIREVLMRSPFSVYLATSNTREDWADAPDVSYFLGRETDLNTLKQWVIQDRCRLVAIVGLPGKGKTHICAKLAEQLRGKFEGIIWRSLLNAPPVQDIIKDWILFLSHQEKIDLPERLDQQINLLISYLKQHRYLLILDNIETILAKETQFKNYKSGYEDYHQLLEKIAEVSHQSCLLLTSRVKVHHLEKFVGQHQPVRCFVVGGLTVEPVKELFQEKGEFTATETEWETLVNYYQGNPLALKLTACHIQKVFAGNIQDFLKVGNLVFKDIQDLLDWHFQYCSYEEHNILFWLAIYREPVSIAELKDHIVSVNIQQDLLDYLESLQNRMLLERTANQQCFTLQPVLMEYVTEKLITTVTPELITGEFNLFNHHSLILATCKDYIRSSQITMIINPIIESLLSLPQFPSLCELENHFKKLVIQAQEKYPQKPGYIGGNLINLFCYLKTDLNGYNFSRLTIWEANLQGINLQNVNFSDCDFRNTVFTQSFGGIHSLAFTPDGAILAAGDSNGYIHFLNPEDGQPILSFGKHKWWTVALAFSSDGNKLVSSSLHPTVKLWNAKTGQLLKDLEGHKSWVWTVAFSPDNQIIASGSDDKTIKFWDANTGELLRTLDAHNGWVLSVAFSPNGRMLASGSYDKTIKLWDIETGDCLQTLKGHEDAIWCVAFSPDGQTLASCGFEKIIRIWDIKTGDCDRILSGHQKEIKVLAFSPDGETLASGDFTSTVKFWRVKTGECRGSLKHHQTGIRALAFSPDNQTVATGDNDQIIKLWNTKTRKCIKTFWGYTNWVWSIALSRDGQRLASSHLDHKVRLWNPQTQDCLNTLTGHTAWVWSVAFSPDGKTVASSGDDETIRLWDVETGECYKCLKYPTKKYQGGIWTIAFSGDGVYLASGGQDTTIKIWNLKTDKFHVLAGHQSWVWTVRFHPHFPILASGSDDQTIKLWDIKTGDCLQTLRGHHNKVRSIAFSPDSQFLVSGSEDETVKLWDLETGKCVYTLLGHQGWIWSVDFSPDGRFLASGSDDFQVKLWDFKTGNCLYSLKKHTNTVTSVMFSPDHQTLLTSSEDGTIKFWQVKTGKCLKTLIIPNSYTNMNITETQGLSEGQKHTLKALGAVEY